MRLSCIGIGSSVYYTGAPEGFGLMIDVLFSSVSAWATYCAGFAARYFVLAGGLFWLLHVVWKTPSLAYRIQPKFPERESIRHEVWWSMSNMSCSGIATALTVQLTRAGHTSYYSDIAEYGWLYLIVSAALCVLGYDTWMYFEHRLLHTPWLFRHVHSVHHRVGNPTALGTFSHHPIETFMGNTFFVLFVVFVPAHPLALLLAGVYMFFTGIIAHVGYEFYPRGFPQHPLFRWVSTSTYHNLHHRCVRSNYGSWFTHWDVLFGTVDPTYEKEFNAITARRPPLMRQFRALLTHHS